MLLIRCWQHAAVRRIIEPRCTIQKACARCGYRAWNVVSRAEYEPDSAEGLGIAMLASRGPSSESPADQSGRAICVTITGRQIVQPRLYDCLVVTQITLNTEPRGFKFDSCQGHSYGKATGSALAWYAVPG